MSLSCGIVGLPNVGKSSLFNAITNSQIPSENFPFCTIDPNVGTVAVPDPRIDKLVALVQAQKQIPATVEFYDIAGLVKGAASGEGLGNAFLSHIRKVSVMVHVVRCFDDDDITHVLHRIDPVGDIDIIETELLLADLATVTAFQEKQNRKLRKMDDGAAHLEMITALADHLARGQAASRFSFDHSSSALWLQELCLLTAKKTLLVANVKDTEVSGNRNSALVEEYGKKHGLETVVICSQLESELASLPPDDRSEFMAEYGLHISGLEAIINTCYRLLGLQVFFTAGEKEVRAWTIPIGASAPEAAGKIHTDFEKGFIRAEVVSYDDFITHKGEQGARNAGLWRLEGKEYIVQEGDVMHFRTAPV